MNDTQTSATRVDAEDCQFEQVNPHEWWCEIHETLKIAGTQEPVFCDWEGAT